MKDALEGGLRSSAWEPYERNYSPREFTYPTDIRGFAAAEFPPENNTNFYTFLPKL